MISTRDIDDIIGAEAVDQDNDKIGKVGQIYLDSQNDEPVWVSVKSGLFGTAETLVPLSGANWDHSELHLAFPKDRVKDAPRVEADAELSPEEQDRLYDYYGVGSGAAALDDSSTTSSTGSRDLDSLAGVQGTAAAGEADHGDSGSGIAADDSTRDLGATGHDTSGPTTDDAMTLSEERLKVGTEQVETGRVRLRKYVVTEQQSITVPVTHEEVRLEREPITDANRDAATDGPALSEEEHEVVLTEERPVVTKETVPVERVRLATEEVTEDRQVSEQVSHEEIATDGDDIGRGVDSSDGLGRRADDPEGTDAARGLDGQIRRGAIRSFGSHPSPCPMMAR